MLNLKGQSGTDKSTCQQTGRTIEGCQRPWSLKHNLTGEATASNPNNKVRQNEDLSRLTHGKCSPELTIPELQPQSQQHRRMLGPIKASAAPAPLLNVAPKLLL